MARKPTVNKGRKSPGGKSKTQPIRRATSSERASLSVTDGDMKNVIRAAFLRRST